MPPGRGDLPSGERVKPEALAALHAFCAAVPLALVRRLADYLRSEADGVSAESCRSRFGLGCEAFFAFRRLTAFFAAPAELATALEIGAFFLEQARSRTSSLVWSGPACVLQPVRTTEQVLLDIIEDAQKEILLVSFAAYRVPPLLHALREALHRGVCVRFVLETAEDSEGQLRHNAANAFAQLRGAFFYHWPSDRRPRNRAGHPAKMHAKCAANETSFLITSANLTGDGINGNMELGILHHDPEKATLLLAQFDQLISRGELRQ